jgi:hypothetical protein
MTSIAKKEVSNRGLQGLLDSLEEIKFDDEYSSRWYTL